MANRVDPNLQVTTNNLQSSNYVPNNKLAIILDCQVGITAEECCEATADIVPGADMMYSSRLSGGRICVFLRTEENVIRLVQEGGLLVRGNFIPIRRYVTQATKIVLSNVSPIISNDQISKELTKIGKLASTIRNISNGYKRPDIAHMISFRRIVYMIIDKPDNIPETINIDHEDKNYLIFVSCDDILCYKCKGSGHIARNCKKIISQQPRLENTNNPDAVKSYADTVANANTNRFTPNFAETSKIVAAVEQPAEATSDTTILSVPKNLRKFDSLRPSQLSPEGGVQLEQKDLPTPKKKNKRKLTPDNSSDEAQELIVKKLLDDKTTHPTLPDTDKVDSDAESIRSTNSYDSTATVKSDASEFSKNRTKKFMQKGNKSIDLFVAKLKPKSHYPLSNKKFNELLKESYGYKPQQLLAVILEFTNDLTGLRTMIRDNLVRSGNFNLKRRLERMDKTLNEELKNLND